MDQDGQNVRYCFAQDFYTARLQGGCGLQILYAMLRTEMTFRDVGADERLFSPALWPNLIIEIP